MGSDFSLSASKLNILRDCQKCFWFHMTKKIERPRGIYPSLPSGMDRIIKEYFDRYRGDMPPELRGKVPGVLWGTKEDIGKLRQWQTGMKPIIQTPHGSVSLIGAIDDLSIDQGLYASVDGKTKGSAYKGDTERYYQVNADVYSLMLRDTGRPPSQHSYFFYVWPEGIVGNAIVSLPMTFNFQVATITADPERAKAMICKATELLSTVGPEGPKAAEACEYCKFAEARKK